LTAITLQGSRALRFCLICNKCKPYQSWQNRRFYYKLKATKI
jgi:hypothetical protein